MVKHTFTQIPSGNDVWQWVFNDPTVDKVVAVVEVVEVLLLFNWPLVISLNVAPNAAPAKADKNKMPIKISNVCVCVRVCVVCPGQTSV